MKLRLLIILLSVSALAQQKAYRFIDAGTRLPVTDADVYADSTYISSTDFNGNFRLKAGQELSALIVRHIAYEERVIPRDSLLIKKVYKLRKSANMLDEVVINKKQQEDTLVPISNNFSWGDRAATYIPYRPAGYISKLRFRVTSELGVKGVNFLSFKANLYEYDSVTKLPGKALLPEDIIVHNKNGDDWAVADVSSYKIKMPPQGVCIGFIIPASDFYKVLFLEIDYDKAIAAVPNLKKVSKSKGMRSFLYLYSLEGGEWVRKWKPVKDRMYKMEIELSDAPN